MEPKLVTAPGAAADGVLETGSAVITGIVDSSILVGALGVSGVGVPSGTFVESIDDAHTITLTKPATLDGAQRLTFTMEPVSIAEARLHLRQTDTSEDALIARLIAAARRACERRSRRTFLTSTWDYTLDNFPVSYRPFGSWPLVRYPYAAEIRIPNPPLVEITALSYVDSGGSSVPIGPASYSVTAGTPGILVPTYGTVWPFTRGMPGDVMIRYVAGYGATADSVPDDAKVAILLMLSHLYDNRGDVEAAVPSTVAEMLAGVAWGSYS